MKKLYFLLLALMAVVTVSAQVTTASISGRITDQNGKSLVGATVIAVHTPSGSQYGTAANSDGRYALQGLRTGGPYTVTVEFVGYKTVEYTGVMLSLGNTAEINASLKESIEIGAIEVVASAKSRFDASKTGAATNFNSVAIQSVPSISRSIYDVAALTPQAIVNKGGGTSFGGANNRYNSFQIDGIVSNDVFGLADTGMNGGQTGANPLSLDAIEEIQVVVAPFDVRQSGFTGGGINAITKSGTNQYKGSAYVYYNDQHFYGDRPNGGPKNPLDTQSTKIFGATIGGPIIKDKLFFFVSGEYNKDTHPATYYVGQPGSVTEDQLKALAAQYKTLTGFETGGYGKHDIDVKSGSLLARIDWNISKNHKLSVRYNYLDATKDKYSSGATSFYFGGASYVQSDRTHSLVGELNSRLSDNLSNELRVGWTRVRDWRDVDSKCPNVSVTVANSYTASDGKTKNQNNTVYMGTEYSSGANRLNQDIYTITDNLTWYKGNHTLTFGTHNEIYHIFNLFVQNNTGSWSYNSYQDFMDNKPSNYIYKFTNVAGNKSWGPSSSAAQFGLYAQDEWKPNRDFTLTYGLRIDMPVIFTNPTTNAAFNATHFATDNNVTVGSVPKTKIMWAPRVGFRWYADDAHHTLLRGGVGIFTGRVPFVWISNNFTNTGIEVQTTTSSSTTPAPALTPELSQNPPVVGTAGVGTPDICVVKKNFRYPQVFRTNLALEQDLGAGFNLTLEALYTKTLNNVKFTNLLAENKGHKVYAVSEAAANADNTTVYYDLDQSTYNSAICLGNTNKGYTYSFTAKIDKTFDFGLFLSAAYTFGHAKSTFDATSSVAYSNFGYNYALEQNNPELATSLFDVPHRIVAQLSYSKRYAKYFGSSISLVYTAFSGQPYTFYYYNKKGSSMFNNNGFNYGNTLGYIPTDAEIELMSWKSAADKDNFKAYVESDSYMSSHRGQFSKRNALRNPFEHHLDLHFAQDFYFGAQTGRKIQLTLDILNFTNMLNNDWGTYYGNTYGISPLTVTNVTKNSAGDATPIYSFYQPKITPSDFYSRWHMQIGARIVF